MLETSPNEEEVVGKVSRQQQSQHQDDVSSTVKRDKMEKNSIPMITDTRQLLQYGICRVPFMDTSDNYTHGISKQFPLDEWVSTFTTISPYQQMMEGDLEYALYRNIMEEQEWFPFKDLYNVFLPTLQAYFGIVSSHELQLDDAFCVHYNMDQYDTSGAKHMDPSDITINICIECTPNVQGSQVKFYGKQPLLLLLQDNDKNNDNRRSNGDIEKQVAENDNTKKTKQLTLSYLQQSNATSVDNDADSTADKINNDDGDLFQEKRGQELDDHHDHENSDDEFQFLVEQIQGYATIHWGHHAHQTMPLENGGRRTNIILTYRYTDPDKRQNVALRTCY